MRLPYDQNLSHRLLPALEDIFPGSLHVRSVGLAEADDLSIWNHAKDNQLVVVTQDSDYSDWNKLRGSPPKIVWLRCGNASTDQIHSKLRHAADRILALDSDPDAEVVEIW
jgi:predicted nuclease of predicted toxin-antitoxin system